ncbi:hypothetical protein M0Q50_03600 [bacterium]|jgi:transcription elongation factor Elf1|nr:hypothetical protein [bacterium]
MKTIKIIIVAILILLSIQSCNKQNIKPITYNNEIKDTNSCDACEERRQFEIEDSLQNINDSLYSLWNKYTNKLDSLYYDKNGYSNGLVNYSDTISFQDYIKINEIIGELSDDEKYIMYNYFLK